MDRISITDLKIIASEGGEVMHVLKKSELSYQNFGEAYISKMNPGANKPWKCHTKMMMNLIVPKGLVKFTFKEELDSQSVEVTIGETVYRRITVEPGVWFKFENLSHAESIVINIANIEHDPDEVIRLGAIK